MDDLVDFELCMAVQGFGKGPIGLLAALKFKMLDSQSDSSNMGPVWIDVRDFCVFSKKVPKLGLLSQLQNPSSQIKYQYFI